VRADGRVFAGAIVGGLVGYFAFFWLLRHGYYALMLPGALVGIGAGVFRSASRLTPLSCALIALALGYFTEWRFAGRVQDLPDLAVTMIALGTFAGFWVPFRRRLRAGRR
jgi:hypothetical protein